MEKNSRSKPKKTMTNATTKSSSKRTTTTVTTKSSSKITMTTVTTKSSSTKPKSKITNKNSSSLSKSIKVAPTKPRSNAKSKKAMASATQKSRSNSKSKKPMTGTTKKPRFNSKALSHNTKHNDHGTTNTSPVEIMGDQLFEATGGQYSSFFELNYMTIHSIKASTFSGNTSFSNYASTSAAAKKRPQPPDIEDSCDIWKTTQKRRRLAPSSLFKRFRNTTGLFVSDISATEWCEKKMEYGLTLGKRETNEAMKAGSARHLQLEEEVVAKVKVSVETSEDFWALKFMNFISGANQLIFENLTRELPVIGFFEGVPLVGKVDEIRMPGGEVNGKPILVDTKTRVRDTLPSEAQKRNGRLQLMCYKYLWDDLVADKFPYKTFFEFFSLDPDCKLSEDIREKTASEGYGSETLLDVVKCFRRTCSILRPANNQMLLRYELQKDNSLLGEDQFAYDPQWFKSQIKGCLQFWLGNREASYVPEDESWKCRYCQFASVCPANITSDTSGNSPTTSDSSSGPQYTSDMSSDSRTIYEISCDSETSSFSSSSSSYYCYC